MESGNMLEAPIPLGAWVYENRLRRCLADLYTTAAGISDIATEEAMALRGSQYAAQRDGLLQLRYLFGDGFNDVVGELFERCDIQMIDIAHN